MNARDLQDLAEVVSKAGPKELAMVALTMLGDIREELIALRKATEQANEPGPEDEPSPFQSLSG